MQNKIIQYLEKCKNGYLVITTPCNNEIDIGDKNSILKADLQISDWKLVDLVIAKGDIGFGEAYIKGYYNSSNLPNLLLFMLSNVDALKDIYYGKSLYKFLFTVKNLFKRNTVSGSKKNIKYHYDLGNDFYQKWLDKSMTYSSGIFYDNTQSLEVSQENKYQKIIDELNKNGKNILEIGCGWGGFISCAEKNGYIVKGLTLSKEQQEYVDRLIEKNNLKSRTSFQDYRHEDNMFDNIVSIEMFEAVGKKYWDDYFKQIKKCLNKDGVAVIQTITIDKDFYNDYLTSSDFIREYIFPGGFLPSEEIFENLAINNGFVIKNKYDFAVSYEKTLLSWLNNFDNAKNDLLNMGYNEEFIKKWRFYLSYCAVGFRTKRTNIIQYSLIHA